MESKHEEDIKPSKSGSVLFPSESKFAHIKNKQVRTQQFQKIKRELKKVSKSYTMLKRNLMYYKF